MDHPLVRYSPEMEDLETVLHGPPEAARRRTSSDGDVFGENDLLELAAETLEATAASALTPNLERLIERAARALGRPVDPALARPLTDLLRWAAQRAMPIAARSVVLRADGSGVAAKPPAPSLPRAPSIARATRLFGLELEGLSPEDKEFELAKGFVRLVGDTVRHAVALPRSAPAASIALRALTLAARHVAPALVPELHPRSGRRFAPPPGSKERIMHDIDRTNPGYANEFAGFHGEQFEFGEAGILNEAEEMELAAELLAVSNEGELDQFLGNLVSRATRAVGSFVRSPIGQAVGGVLKGVAKKALPMAGAAVGSYIGGPLGAKIGTGLANAASNALGLEAEMAGEDREFEGARQFVRLAAQTAASAAAAPPGADPRAVAQQAATAAAQRLAPGLLSGTGQAPVPGTTQRPGMTGNSGRWLRRGSKIVLYGV